MFFLASNGRTRFRYPPSEPAVLNPQRSSRHRYEVLLGQPVAAREPMWHGGSRSDGIVVNTRRQRLVGPSLCRHPSSAMSCRSHGNRWCEDVAFHNNFQDTSYPLRDSAVAPTTTLADEPTYGPIAQNMKTKSRSGTWHQQI